MTRPRNVLGIVGSYRKDCTVDSVVNDVLAAAEARGARTEKIYLTEWRVEFCTNCRQCTQEAGPERVSCFIHDDQMDEILARAEAADAIVIGAPVNVGGVNAVTQRFVERCIGYYHWPWDSAAPKLRNEKKSRKAVLVSSSAAPAYMNNKLFGVNALHPLKAFAAFLGAEVTDVIKVGLTAKKEPVLSSRVRHKNREAGETLAG